MMLHVVLFTPRATVTAPEREQFGRALEEALTGIPSVRRFRVGRRVRTGAAYDALPGSFQYCGVIEFDDHEGLAAYLAHPAHRALGELFYVTSAEAFAGDFDAVEQAPAAALARWTAQPDAPPA